MQNSKIYVGNLPNDTSEDQVREFFQKCGEIQEIRLINDRDTGDFRGFGFITYRDSSAAQEAIASLNGEDFGGRNLRVNEAQDRGGRRTGGGAGAGGGGGNRRF